MAAITLHGITKRFGGFLAVKDLGIEIQDGEFLTLLGPSGCGKTTTLRMLAGLEDPDAGEIYFDDDCVFSTSRGIITPTGRRQIGMIFQSYALWPHMTVVQNVAFGLEEKGISRAEIRRRSMSALETVQLQGLEARYPSELSGGQQQRVALARVLAVQPKTFLMDEPLSNLDAKLRIEMRGELKRLHAETGTTTVYVTHDQYEALTMSDRIAVMRDGTLQQLDTAQAIYERPINLYVANFVGNIPINLVRGAVQRDGTGAQLVTQEGLAFRLPDLQFAREAIVMAIRPEHLRVHHHHSDGALRMAVQTVLPAGSEGILQVIRGSTVLMVKQTEFQPLKVKDEVWVTFDPKRVLLFDVQTERLIVPHDTGGS